MNPIHMEWTEGIRRGILLPTVSIMFFLAAIAWGDRTVFRSISAEGMTDVSRMVNGDFETGTDPALPGWTGWGAGYKVQTGSGRGGSRGVRCSSNDSAKEYGVSQTIMLNQDQPRPILAAGWSKAEDVDGGPDMGYSLYLDILFTDGTPLWAQTANFSTGTHDWERRTRIVIPAKPIRSVTVLGLFRHHRGTVFFDDFALLETSEDSPLFEGGLVQPGDALPAHNGTSGAIEPFLFVRDVAADGDFIAVGAWEDQNGKKSMAGNCEEAELRFGANRTERNGVMDISVRVSDLRNTDRAITLYIGIPVAKGNWVWWDGPRKNRTAENGVYVTERYSGAGATSTRSLYPLAVLTGPASGWAMAVPLDEPRHTRLGYFADHGLLFAAFDFGLSPDTRKSPGSAACTLKVFSADPTWGFRGALARYYALFPKSFVKRVKQEGLWMAFTDIATVKGWQDFGFAYHEGTNAVAWDEANDILSFAYIEPMTTWVSFSPDVPRTYDGAMAYLEKQCAEGNAEARKTRLSGVRGPTGCYTLSIENAPWCNGAVYALNADPELPPTDRDTINQGQYGLNLIETALAESRRAIVEGWWHFGDPYTPDAECRSEGKQSIRVEAVREEGQTGAVQWVSLGQTDPEPLLLRASIRRGNLSGEADADCGVFVDLWHVDGTPLFAQTLPAPPGTGEFDTMERIIASDKPFASARIHLLMRGKHTGTVWFDDLYLGDADGQRNRLANPGCEGKLRIPDGIGGAYLDSYEFWATNLDYERAHFAGADLPLVFDPHTHQPGVLAIFSTFEFHRELAKRMHAQGKLMMANGVLHNFDFPAAHLDVLGTETNWFPSGKWSPMSDEELLYKRAMSYRKPYCFLMNTHYASLTPGDIERYMQRSMFYGMFPGFFSENAATDCFFAHPEWYEPSRPLFRKYMPVIRALAAAGWEPITHAQSSDGRVLVEQFGGGENGPLYFTCLNDSREAVTASVSWNSKALKRNPKRSEMRDVLSGERVSAFAKDEMMIFSVSLAPQAAMAVVVQSR